MGRGAPVARGVGLGDVGTRPFTHGKGQSWVLPVLVLSCAWHCVPQGARGAGGCGGEGQGDAVGVQRVQGTWDSRSPTTLHSPSPVLGGGPLPGPPGAAVRHLPRAPGGSEGVAAGCSRPAWGRDRAAGLVGAPAGLSRAPCSPVALGLCCPHPEELPCCRERSRGAAPRRFIAAGVRGDRQLIRGY